jgi:hypothetical protein
MKRDCAAFKEKANLEHSFCAKLRSAGFPISCPQ